MRTEFFIAEENSDTVKIIPRSGDNGHKKGMAETVKEGEFPNLKEIMDQAMKAGVKLLVCEQSTRLLRMERGEFVPVTKVVGAGTLND